VARALVDVRRVTAGELGDVLELWNQGRDEITLQGRQSTSAEQVGPRLADALAAGQIEILLARREGRPAGFLILRETPLTFMVDQPAICIDQLFVAVEARRHGVARAMLSLVAGRAERSGAEQVVSSVPPWARETHRFFARLGFTPVTVRRSVTPAMLRRRLTGEPNRRGLEDLLARRRSLRARARRRPVLAMVASDVPLEGESQLDDGGARLA
jgi:GNAT superfamily N-acetyltransferase